MKKAIPTNDFPARLYVHVCDRDGDDAILNAQTNLIGIDNNEKVAIYSLVELKTMTVTRRLKSDVR